MRQPIYWRLAVASRTPAIAHGTGAPTSGTIVQGGFAMVELVIATAIACLLAIWAADKLMRDVDDVLQQSSGQWLQEIREAMQAMLRRHGPELAAARKGAGDEAIEHVRLRGQKSVRKRLPDPAWSGNGSGAAGIAAFAMPLAPTFEELRTLGFLSATFPLVGPAGMEVALRVVPGKDCPGEACHLDAVAYTRSPVLSKASSEPDFSRIAGIVMASNGAGGSVSALQPARLRGGLFDLPNPPAPDMAPLPIGTVAVWAGVGAGSTTSYLQPRDQRDPRFRGDLTAKGDVSAQGRLVAGEHLKLGRIVSEDDPCAENGLLARDAAGSVLSCVRGRWAIPGGFGGAFSFNSVRQCRSERGPSINPRTGKCSCPASYRAVQVSQGGIKEWHGGIGWTAGFICIHEQ